MSRPPDDATVLIRPRKEAGKRRWLLIGVGLLVAAMVAAGLWWRLAPSVDRIAIRPADEAMIRDNATTELDVFRFALNPRILVLDFKRLARQGAMLNRLAAMAEKLGAPHDEALDDAALDRVIRAGGDTPETFYLGHDYGESELTKFFASVDRQKLTLSVDEQWLRRLLRQEANATGALSIISVPALNAPAGVDPVTRASILHHELSHGEFFTNPAYAAYVRGFWANGLEPSQRAAFTRFLTAENYDPAIEELLANEMQAYLMFTANPKFFTPRLVDMDDAAIERLRAKFRAGMPKGWLRDTP